MHHTIGSQVLSYISHWPCEESRDLYNACCIDFVLSGNQLTGDNFYRKRFRSRRAAGTTFRTALSNLTVEQGSRWGPTSGRNPALNQWCHLITISIIRVVRDEFSVANRLIEIQTVSNPEQLWESWNRLAVGFVGDNSILSSQGEYVVFCQP